MDPPLVSKRIKWCRLYYCSPLPQCHSSVHDTRGIRTTTDARSNMATERGTQGSFTAQMQQLATGWWAVSIGGDCDPSWRTWHSRRSCPQQEKKQGRETVTEAARTARSDQQLPGRTQTICASKRNPQTTARRSNYPDQRNARAQFREHFMKRRRTVEESCVNLQTRQRKDDRFL